MTYEKIGMCMTCGDQVKTILHSGVELCFSCARLHGLDAGDDETEEDEEELSELIGRKVLKAKTTKHTCMQCSRSVTLLYSEDMGSCERCDNTSFNTSDGRPWGPKHSMWNDMVKSEYHLTDDNRITERSFNMIPEDYVTDCFELEPVK